MLLRPFTGATYVSIAVPFLHNVDTNGVLFGLTKSACQLSTSVAKVICSCVLNPSDYLCHWLAICLNLLYIPVLWCYGYCNRCCHGMVGPSVCMFVILMQPAKAIGQNEMPFGSDTCMAPSDSALDRGIALPWDGRFRSLEPQVKVCITYCGKSYSAVSCMILPFLPYATLPSLTTFSMWCCAYQITLYTGQSNWILCSFY